MIDNDTLPLVRLTPAINALLAAPPAGGLVLVAGGTLSGKSRVATALTEQLAARVGMSSVALCDDNFVPYLAWSRNQTDVVVQWDEIRDRVSFMLFLAHTRQRFTIGVIHAPSGLDAVRNLLWYAGQLEESQRDAAITAVRARLVAFVETGRKNEVTVITPVRWPQ